MYLHLVFMLYVFSFMFLFWLFLVLLYLLFIKIKIKLKNTKTVCVCVCWYLCTFDGHWNKISKLCISCSLDEHLNAQLRKWTLWLVVVMGTIKIVSYISYSYHSFWREGLENPKRKTYNHLITKARQSCIKFVCFGIAKLWCFDLHNWVFFFSLLYAHACYA